MPATSRPVIAGVDGTPGALGAARWAAAVADKLEVPLCIVHAKPYAGHNFSDALAGARAASMAEAAESASAVLASAEHAVRTEFADLPLTTMDLPDAVDDALIDMSRDARMIVLGCDEISPSAAILVGSPTLAVIGRSSCPVVAWRGEATLSTNRPLVIGADGGEHTRLAVALTFELANRLGVGVIAVHAWSRHRPVGETALPFMIDWSAVEQEQRQQFVDALTPWLRSYPDVDVRYVVNPVKPSMALLRESANAQLVVVGSRGRGPVAGAVLGSTGLNLLHHCARPVMICPSRSAAG